MVRKITDIISLTGTVKIDTGSTRPPDDALRVAGVRDSGLLDSPSEERFDRLIRELAAALDAPVAYLALIDAERQWLKSKVGEIATQVHRDDSFCNHAILGSEPMLIEDASRDPRFSGSPLVTHDPKLRSYAGMPVIDRTGNRIGTVCVADYKARRFEREEISILLQFAARVQREIHALPRVFVSYAAGDGEWKDRLLASCGLLEEHGLLDLWGEDRVAAEENGEGLREAVERATLAVLLLTERYLESGLAGESELATHLRRRIGEGLEVLPVVVGACDWDRIYWLAALGIWPPDARPIAAGEVGRIEEDFKALTSRIAVTLRRVAPPLLTADGEPRAIELTKPARRLFLSHSVADASAAREIASRLRQTGLEVWLDEEVRGDERWSRAVDGALQEADAFAVYVGRSGIDQWVGRDVRAALERNMRDPGFRILPLLGAGASPESLPFFLSQYQAVKIGEGAPEPAELQRLVGAVLESAPEEVSLIPAGQAPFLGLLAFDVEHSHLFFGRDGEIEELLERLEAAPFLAVVGDSGSGKSSLVRAGLVPAVHRGQFRAGGSSAGTWNVMILKPGDEPFAALAAALVELCPDQDAATRIRTASACAKQLGEGVDGLSGCIAGIAGAGTRTLVVVDQFEEIFTLVEKTDDRRRFIDTLLRAATESGDRPVHCLITLRADFLAECWSHTELWKAIRVNEYSVSRIGRERLRDVIEKPAVMAGARFEPGLTDRILTDVGDEPGNLPLLEHALLELWERRSQRLLTHAAYEEIGGLEGALEHRAEEIFERLDDEEKRQAKRIYLNLVSAGARTEATRRRSDLRDVVPSDAAGGPAQKVLDRLVEERLVITSRTGDSEKSEETVEIAHEALIRGWKRLQQWLDEDREFLLWRQRANSLFRAWKASSEDDEALLRGAPLAEAQRWLGERGADLHPDGRAFIEKSIGRARRRRWVKLGFVGMLAVLFLISAFFAFIAKRAQQGANQEARRANQEASKAERVVRFLTDDMLNAANPRSEMKPGMTAAEILAAGAERIEDDETLKDEPLTKALLLNTIGTIYRNLGEKETAEAQFRLALEIYEREKGSEREYAEVLNNLGVVHYDRKERAAARELFTRALEIRQSAGVVDGTDLALNRCSLALVDSELGNSEEALQGYELALQSFGENPQISGTSVSSLDALATCQNNFADLLDRKGDLEEARKYYETSLAIRRAAHRKESHPDIAQSTNNLGFILHRLAEREPPGSPARAEYLAEAEARHERAVQLWRENRGDPIELAWAWVNLGWVREDQGFFSQCEKPAEEARKIFSEKEDNYGEMIAMSVQGGCLAGSGSERCEEAAALLSSSIDGIDPEEPDFKRACERFRRLRQNCPQETAALTKGREKCEMP